MKKILILILLVVVLTACVPKGLGQKVSFDYPDIKDDFCGVQINFQFCKCAFHNEYCDAVGMKKSEANTYVRSEYDKWLAGKLASFGAECASNGGIFNADQCQYCAEGYKVQNGKCANLEDLDSSASQFKPDGPLSSDCKIIPDQFEADWKKYSDIDNAIAFEERSFEAKQALIVYETMISKMVEAFALERDVEIAKQMQAELKQYQTALTNNIKANLLKAFWRLSWVTYTTIKSGSSLGESYESLLESGVEAETVGAGLKLIQGIIPNDSVLAIDTSTTAGKVKSVGVSVALEAVDSLGDPVKIATELFNSATNAALPSADITEEEIAILKDQHLKQGVIVQTLADSQAQITASEAKLIQLEAEISQLGQQVGEWENKEKQRVQTSLESSCQELKKQFDEES